jgi:alpha-N-arabinofuranosidase
VDIAGKTIMKISGRILTGEKINEHNTFAKPDAVKPRYIDDIMIKKIGFSFTMPKASVAVLEIECD